MDIYVQKDGQQQGPFPESRIRQGIDGGEFDPADLAWTAGKAAWQPLSILIGLDVTQAPPIPTNGTDGNAGADVIVGFSSGSDDASKNTYRSAGSTASPRPVVERILYEDGPSFQPDTFTLKHESVRSPHVLVTTKRIKINSDNYSLNGLTSAKVECFTESTDGNKSFRQHKMLLRLAYVLFAVDIGASVNYSYFLLFLLLGVLLVVNYAWRAKDRSEVEKVATGYLLLEYHGNVSKLLVGACHVGTEWRTWELKRCGKTDEQIARRQQDHILHSGRPEKIMEAIGIAIGQGG
jgi:hypothetical protein